MLLSADILSQSSALLIHLLHQLDQAFGTWLSSPYHPGYSSYGTSGCRERLEISKWSVKVVLDVSLPGLLGPALDLKTSTCEEMNEQSWHTTQYLLGEDSILMQKMRFFCKGVNLFGCLCKQNHQAPLLHLLISNLSLHSSITAVRNRRR